MVILTVGFFLIAACVLRNEGGNIIKVISPWQFVVLFTVVNLNKLFCCFSIGMLWSYEAKPENSLSVCSDGFVFFGSENKFDSSLAFQIHKHEVPHFTKLIPRTAVQHRLRLLTTWSFAFVKHIVVGKLYGKVCSDRNFFLPISSWSFSSFMFLHLFSFAYNKVNRQNTSFICLLS